jgi:hypothetical protein
MLGEQSLMQQTGHEMAMKNASISANDFSKSN